MGISSSSHSIMKKRAWSTEDSEIVVAETAQNLTSEDSRDEKCLLSKVSVFSILSLPNPNSIPDAQVSLSVMQNAKSDASVFLIH